MTTNKLHSISDCVSTEQLILYAQGKLTAKQKHSIEAHALNCPMCADALEGALLLEKPELFESVVSTIDSAIIDRANRKIWMVNRTMLLAAASVIVLFTLSVYVLLYVNSVTQFEKLAEIAEETAAPEESFIHSDTSKVTNFQPGEAELTEPSSVVLSESHKTSKIAKEPPGEDLDESSTISKEIIQTEIADAARMENFSDSSLMGASTDSKKETIEKLDVESNNKLISESAKMASAGFANEKEAKQEKMRSRKFTADKKSSKTENYIEIAMQLYENKQYTESLEQIKLHEKLNKPSAQSELLKAKCHLKLNNYADAEQILKNLTNAGGNFADSAIFYLRTIPQNRAIKN